MNDGKMLYISLNIHLVSIFVELTLRDRALAISNAICPILLDARSVMRRVARASLPFSV